MIQTTILKRKFSFNNNGKDIELADISPKMTTEAVRNFYSNTYPILTTAKIEGPKIKDDCIEYSFVSTIGTKG